MMSARLPRLSRPLGIAASALLFALPVPLFPAHAAQPEHAHGAAPTAGAVPPAAVAPAQPAPPVRPAPTDLHAGHGAPAPAAPEPQREMGPTPRRGAGSMDMGAMQGGRAPADARDPDAYADGYENSNLPGFERTDQLAVGQLLIDQLEFVTGNEGDGIAWSARFAHGPDDDKFVLRTQGLAQSRDRLDPETGVEALWWHAYSPFWGRTLGVRQDIGRGAHSWLAVGIEGLAPYWFDIELTGYVSDAGHLSVRARAAYDLLLTNRLILTPSAETNIFSKSQRDRQLGAGVSNLELGLRLRYEIDRRFAPYIGLAWERAFGGTADFRRLEGDPVTERRLAVGVRLLW